jgi:hypothetical protein
MRRVINYPHDGKGVARPGLKVAFLGQDAVLPAGRDIGQPRLTLYEGDGTHRATLFIAEFDVRVDPHVLSRSSQEKSSRARTGQSNVIHALVTDEWIRQPTNPPCSCE